MAFPTTDAAIKTRAREIMGYVNDAELDAKIDGHVAAGNTRGYNEILSKLRGRGYTLAQIGSWMRAEEFHVDLGAFWTLNAASLYNGENQTHRLLDRRQELDTVTLLDGAGDVIVAGALDEVGAVAYGRLDDDGRNTDYADEHAYTREFNKHW